MKKLTIKELACYLPYGLQIKDETAENKVKTMIGSQGSSGNWVSVGFVVKYQEVYKPILRPLSDLTKEIEVNGERFVPNHKYPFKMFVAADLEYFIGNISSAQYHQMEKLFEWHFDVFGLIENGLAVDINSLTKSAA